MKQAATGVALVAVVMTGMTAPRALSQEPAPRKSVYGKLESIVEGQRAVVMRSDDDERLVWRFQPEVVAAIREFEPGAEMIVIYHQTQQNQKVVTAVAFPGAASVPTYVNLTGSRVLLRSGPSQKDSCDVPGPAVSETPILAGGRAETEEACWCCATEGATCAPTTRTGLGRAFLVRCFD